MGQSAESHSFLSVCFIVSVTVFRTPGCHVTIRSEDKSCSDETQVKYLIHPSTEHTNDSLTGTRVSKPQCPTKVVKNSLERNMYTR